MSRPYKLETPRTIHNWALETFDAPDVKHIAVRTNREVAELLSAVLNGEDETLIQGEIADVAIMLWQLAAATNNDARPEKNYGELVANAMVGVQKEAAVQRKVLELNFRYARYLEKLFIGDKKVTQTAMSECFEVLETIIRIVEMDLPAAVDAKMAINRRRVWTKTSAHNHQHVSA